MVERGGSESGHRPCYRIGQQNPVQVYKLIAQDTIEEKIVELQQAKQDLAETVTGSAMVPSCA